MAVQGDAGPIDRRLLHIWQGFQRDQAVFGGSRVKSWIVSALPVAGAGFIPPHGSEPGWDGRQWDLK